MSVLTNLIQEREAWANKHSQYLARRTTMQSFLYYVYMALLIIMVFNLHKIIAFIKSI
jgi:hypothetical protein